MMHRWMMLVHGMIHAMNHALGGPLVILGGLINGWDELSWHEDGWNPASWSWNEWSETANT